MPESSPLVAELVRRIRAQGPIPFVEFMRAALYHPEHGYYATGRPAGAADFRTSPQVHRGFGELLARQAEEMWRLLGSGPIRIVELGPGDGALAESFLGSFPEEGDWEYHLVESSPVLERLQRERLARLPASLRGRVAWSGAQELADRPRDGVVLSNEFFDALPVRAVHRTAGALHEVYVDLDPAETGFVEVLRPVEDDGPGSYLQRYGAALEDGHRGEVCLEALEWVDRMAAMLVRGWVITIDYGDTADRLYGPRRPAGTLLAYHRHRAEADLLGRAGEQDLTAHVNFTALARRGQERGLRAADLRTQTEFLLALGALERMAADSGAARPAERWRDHFGWKELFAPGGMGETFRVLVQGKGTSLDGLRGLGSPWADVSLTEERARSSVPSRKSG